MITRLQSISYLCMLAALMGSKSNSIWAQDQSVQVWPEVSSETLENGMQTWTLSSDAYAHSTAVFSWDYKRALGLEKAGLHEAMARCISAAIAQDTVGTGWSMEWDIQDRKAVVNGPSKSQHLWGSRFIGSMISPDFEALWPPIQADWLESWSTVMAEPEVAQSRVSRFTVFGAQHPFGEIPTAESVSNISWEDIQAFHSTYWRPNNATLVLASPSSSLEPDGAFPGAWREALSPWIPRIVEASSIINPSRPRDIQAAIIDRNTDSLRVTVSHIIRMKPDHPDALGLALLDANLEWDESGCQLVTDEIMGTCACQWMDTAEEIEAHVQRLLDQMRDATAESIAESKMDTLRKTLLESVSRKLQQAATAAEIWTEHASMRVRSAAELESALEGITNRDIRRIAINYLRPNNLQIVVQGNRDASINALTSFLERADFRFFDSLAHPMSNYAPAPPGVTAQDIVDSFYEASGGISTFETLKGLMQRGTMTAGGSMVMNYESLDAYGIGHRTTFSLEDQVMMEYRIREHDGISFQMGKQRDMTEAEFLRYQHHLIADYLRHVTDWGYELELAGSSVLDGQESLVIEMSRKGTLVHSFFFDANSRLLVQSKEVRNGPTGPVELTTTYGDYQWFEGIKLPRQIDQLSNNQKMNIRVEEVKLNPRVDKAIFAWE